MDFGTIPTNTLWRMLEVFSAPHHQGNPARIAILAELRRRY